MSVNNHNLIFLHLPKNGGNTLHYILNRVYPKNKTFSIKVVDNTRLNTQDFIALSPEERANINLLKGHMLFGLHKHLIGPSKYITFLRRPESRVISFYNYVKKRPNHRLYNMITNNNMSLLDFVIAANEGDVNNAQIRWISGLPNGTETEMLEKAKQNIDQHFSFVGLQEHFDACLLLLSKQYGWGVPYYKHLNKGTHTTTAKSLDSTTKNAITERNKGDQQLYDYIEKVVLERIEQTHSLALQLKTLRLVNKLHSSHTLTKLRQIFKS